MKNEHRKERISSFEDLEAWQVARRLVNAIYVLTRLSKVWEIFGFAVRCKLRRCRSCRTSRKDSSEHTLRKDPVLQCRARFSG